MTGENKYIDPRTLSFTLRLSILVFQIFAIFIFTVSRLESLETQLLFSSLASLLGSYVFIARLKDLVDASVF